LLLTRENVLYPWSWSPDGQTLAFYEINPTTNRDIWTLSRDGDATPFVASSFDERAAMFSPDGRWIAYVSDESGRDEVYVQPFPGPGGKWPVSTDGGVEPQWSPDARELFYRQGEQMMVVAVETQPTFTVGRPRLVFESMYTMGNVGNPNYDISPDGQRFLMIKATEEEVVGQINVVLNWFEELKRLAPTN